LCKLSVHLTAGKLSDRIEPRIVASIGNGSDGVGIGLFIVLDEKTPLFFILGNLILLGFGYGFFSVPNSTSVMISVESRFYGMASGMLSTMRITGDDLQHGNCSFDIFVLPWEGPNYTGYVSGFLEMYQIDLCLVYRPLFWRSLCLPGKGNVR